MDCGPNACLICDRFWGLIGAACWLSGWRMQKENGEVIETRRYNWKSFMKYFFWTILLWLLVSGAAWAQQTSIKQRLLMPGEVVEGHAEFEAQCEECHSSFDQAAMPNLCLDCHDEIRADRNSKKGFHGQSPLASVQPCQNCHTDHLG